MEQILITEPFNHSGNSYQVEYAIEKDITVAALNILNKEQGVLVFKFQKMTDGLHFLPMLPTRQDENMIEELKAYLIKHIAINTV